MNITLIGHTFQYQAEQIVFLFFREPDKVTITSRYDETEKTVTTYCRFEEKENTYTLFLHAPFTSDDVLLSAFFAASPLSDLTAPWGILTGTRPTKQARRLLAENGSEEKARRLLKERFLVRDDKIDLLFSVLHAEAPILSSQDPRSVSLFIGIPICPSRCLYCSFGCVPAGKREKKIPPYLDALFREIDAVGAAFSKSDRFIETVYIGGGTPTVLTPSELSSLFEHINASFDLSHVREYTLEAGRPDTFTPEKLLICKQNGVDRLCINPQTMQDETLRLIGRAHTAQDIKTAFLMAREIGFSHINCDLILGLPKETCEQVRHTVDQVLSFSPEAITLHTLYIKRASELRQSNDFSDLPAPREVEAMIKHSADTLLRSHYHPYYMYKQKNTLGNFENVGYCKDGFDCLYNIYIIEETQSILSVGAGGVTKMVDDDGRNHRLFNPKDILMYEQRVPELIVNKEHLF